MSEEKEETKITLTITLPTKQKIIETLQAIFPGITVEVAGEKEETEETEETRVEP